LDWKIFVVVVPVSQVEEVTEDSIPPHRVERVVK
jgi:hypothetical protein